jgi:hypothetical protein
MGFKTHFEVEKVSAVRANRGSRGSLKQPFCILHEIPSFRNNYKKIKKNHGGYLGQK